MGDAMNNFMKLAIKEATDGINKHHGGPFGCVIVKDGLIVSQDHNRVLSSHDATAHGEVNAIRRASKNLKTHDLSGCILYTTGEPCPMCLCACMWANISKIYYGCTINDNEIIGFRDQKFDKMFGGRKVPEDYLECIDRDECLKLFDKYNDMEKELY